MTRRDRQAYTNPYVSRLLHLALVLFLVATTGLLHALPAGVGCDDGGAVAQAPCDCCEHEEAEDQGALADPGCTEGCAFCVCCPVRTAITAQVPAAPAPRLINGLAPPGYRAAVQGALTRDIFQPPRA